jgi:hypothetical protein
MPRYVVVVVAGGAGGGGVVVTDAATSNDTNGAMLRAVGCHRIYRLGPGGGIMLVAFDFFNSLLTF